MKNIHSAEVSEVAKIQTIQNKMAAEEQVRAHAHSAKLEQLGERYSELLQQVKPVFFVRYNVSGPSLFKTYMKLKDMCIFFNSLKMKGNRHTIDGLPLEKNF